MTLQTFSFCCKIHRVRLVFNKVHLAKIHSLPICWLTISVHIFSTTPLLPNSIWPQFQNMNWRKKHLYFISFPPHHKSSKIPVIVHFLGFEFTVEFRPFSRASDTLFQASNFCPNIQLQEKLAFFCMKWIFQLWCQNSNMSKNKVLSKLNFWTKIRLLE